MAKYNYFLEVKRDLEVSSRFAYSSVAAMLADERHELKITTQWFLKLRKENKITTEEYRFEYKNFIINRIRVWSLSEINKQAIFL